MFGYEDSKPVEVTACCTGNQFMSKQERYDRCIVYQGKECQVINCAKSTIKLIQQLELWRPRRERISSTSPLLQSIIPINQSNPSKIGHDKFASTSRESRCTRLLPMYQRDGYLLSTGDMNINRPCRMIPIQTDFKGITFPANNT
ncbi:hypothetical protein ARMGADRAFT_1017211 [Armillaria gallica]|uniref:Uncharacterized protein n=1 Tax=Armillaria gallica TaxID=47427 RepID=A0A2H3D6R3_ARMGA|nr:hypothetical protein ARMGADRAFT_1017211 [Armillaria gallica]